MISDEEYCNPRFREEAAFGQLFGRSNFSLAASTSVIEGLPDEQRTSPVRRTFLLIVLFGLLLEFILWIIYVQQSISTGSILEAFRNEVVHYSIQKSLFDNMVLVALRFFVLELIYGAFRAGTPWWSAAVTGATSVFLIVKCFLFDFHNPLLSSNGLVFAVIIGALVLTWIETSFLVYRVIPQEKAAQHVTNYLVSGEQNETQRLLGSEVRSFAPSYDPSMGYHTPEGSLFMEDGGRTIGAHPQPASREAVVDIAAVLDRCSLLQSELWYLYRLEIWGPDPPELSTEIFVRRSKLPEYPHTLFRIEALLDVAPQMIFHELVHNAYESPSWNDTIQALECLQSFPSESLDIVHTVARDALGGAISSRDFVILRTWGEQEENYFIASTSVEHPKCPPIRGTVRCQQLINAVVLSPVPNQPARSKMVWIVCYDLKLSLPRRLLDSALQSCLPRFVTCVRNRVKSLGPDTFTKHPFELVRNSDSERQPLLPNRYRRPHPRRSKRSKRRNLLPPTAEETTERSDSGQSGVQSQ